MAIWNPSDAQNKRKTNFHIVDLAVPVQTLDPSFNSLNTFLSSSLTSISTFLREFYISKQVTGVDYDSNHLTRYLRKSLIGHDINIMPLFFVNSQEDYKDESKQILAFTQQIQGMYKQNEEGQGQNLSPKGQNGNDQVQTNQMVDKLSRENNDLKKQIDFMKKTYKTKLDEFRIMLGIDADLEALIKARPNSKEQQILKFYKEAKERAETLGRINRDLDKKLNHLQNEVDEIRTDKNDLETKYWRQFRAMENKIHNMADGIHHHDKEFQEQIDEVVKQRKVSIDNTLKQNQDTLDSKASLLFKLRENTENNTGLIGRMFDIQDQAKSDAERDYRRDLLSKKRDHKEELQNLKDQYQYLMQNSDEKLKNAIQDFKQLKGEAQQMLSQSREELLCLYQMVHLQQQLIDQVEDGKYSQGMHSHYVPPALKPLMPNKDSHKQLFEALSKKKVKESISSQNYIDKQLRKKLDKQEFIESIMLKTQTIQSMNQKSIAKWEERLATLDLDKLSNQFSPTNSQTSQKVNKKNSQKNVSKTGLKPNNQQRGIVNSKVVSPNLENLKRQSTIKLDQALKTTSVEDIDPSKLNYQDIQKLILELQGGYQELKSSNLNPNMLNGEPVKLIVSDINKFKALYDQEVKQSNERIFNEGKFNRGLQNQFGFMKTVNLNSISSNFPDASRPQTRQLITSQSAFRLNQNQTSGGQGNFSSMQIGNSNVESLARLGLHNGQGQRKRSEIDLKQYNSNQSNNNLMFEAQSLSQNTGQQDAQRLLSQSRNKEMRRVRIQSVAELGVNSEQNSIGNVQSSNNQINNRFIGSNQNYNSMFKV
eukprot:403356914